MKICPSTMSHCKHLMLSPVHPKVTNCFNLLVFHVTICLALSHSFTNVFNLIIQETFSSSQAALFLVSEKQHLESFSWTSGQSLQKHTSWRGTFITGYGQIYLFFNSLLFTSSSLFSHSLAEGLEGVVTGPFGSSLKVFRLESKWIKMWKIAGAPTG